MIADLAWYDVLGRLALAALLGAVVGLERESAGQDAGFRTHPLPPRLRCSFFGPSQ